MSQIDAKNELDRLDIRYVEDTDWDYAVAVDRISRTEPAAGNEVRKGEIITLYISRGPRPIDVPELTGIPEEEALAAITEYDFTVGEAMPKRFSSDIAPGIVIAAYDAQGNQLNVGDQYSEKAQIHLLVSAGPLPAVTEKPIAEANALLEDAGLVPVRGEDAYHDTIAEGNVISAQYADVVSVGDQVTLIVSKGPEPVAVPDNLVGRTWGEVKPQLEALGFKLDYRKEVDALPGFFFVRSINPAPGTVLPKGSTLKIEFSF